MEGEKREEQAQSETLFPSLLMVRGGELRPRDLARSALTCYRKIGKWGLTLWSWPDMDASEIAMRVRQEAEARGDDNPLPHPVIRSSLAANLPGIEEGAATLEETWHDGHYTYGLPILPPESGWSLTHVLRTQSEWWEGISASFGAPLVNPAGNRGKT